MQPILRAITTCPFPIFRSRTSKCYVSGLLGGAMALNLTFMGAQEKVALLIQKRNSIILKESKRSALSSFFQASSEGRTERPE